MTNTSLQEVKVPMVQYYHADTKKEDPIYFEPKILFDLTKPESIDTYSHLYQACHKAVFSFKYPKEITKKYQSVLATKPIWYAKGKYYTGLVGDASVYLDALGCAIMAFMFPISFPQDKIDAIIAKYNVQSHQL